MGAAEPGRPGRLQIHRVRPLDVDRRRVTFDDAPAKVAERHQRDHAFSDLVQHQDVDMGQIVQRNLASGSHHAGRLNPKREDAVHHTRKPLRAASPGYACTPGGSPVP